MSVTGKEKRLSKVCSRGAEGRLGFSTNIFHSFAPGSHDLALLCFLLSYSSNFSLKPKDFLLTVSDKSVHSLNIKNSKIKQFIALCKSFLCSTLERNSVNNPLHCISLNYQKTSNPNTKLVL